MIGSLWTGISGLATHQAALDNESHNIANVNTIGYKSSRISFADQMYQDAIGKGSKVIEAEKIYSQGNIKNTGVAYDVALEGSGFLVVKDPNATGSSEEYFTRAGNLRMGENGTLQDANLYDVIGWTIAPIDPTQDVKSTNPNITRFTNDYVKIAANQIVQKSSSIETITAKLTDYTESAQSDDKSVMSGLGYKSMSTKITDIELLITDYQEKLRAYANDPAANSSPSITQKTRIDLPGFGTSSMKTESDQVYVYINGQKISQNYIETAASTDLTSHDYDGDSVTAATGINNDDHVLASRIATYKALADQISNIPGLRAYMVSDINGTLQEGAETSYSNTFATDPRIVIESIIPGEQFVVGDVAEYIASSNSLVPGGTSSLSTAQLGKGMGAVTSARDALLEAAAGYQRDVWSSSDLVTSMTGSSQLRFSLPNPSSTTPFSVTITEGATTIDTDSSDTTTATLGTSLATGNQIDSLVTAINSHSEMSRLVVAHNYNGNLVVETIGTNPGGTFVGTLEYDADNFATTTVAPVSLNKNTELSINSGADAEFISMINRLDQTASRTELQLRLDNLGISDSAFGDFSVDSTGLITMKQDGAEFAVGQLSIAMFNNERGLKSEGNNLMSKTSDSGNPIYNINNDKAATVAGKALELSTADLSESLVNLMVFQRAFEANSKSITTSDQILTTLIQLKK